MKNRFSSCPVCGNTFLSNFSAKERMFGMAGEFEYFQCKNCEALWIGKIPQDLERYYPNDYYAFKEIKEPGLVIEFLKKMRYKFSKFGIRLKPPVYFNWMQELRADTDHHIADIGCGNGILLHELKACGFKNLYGFDPFIEKSLSLENLVIKKEPFQLLSGQFDILMFHHSFEHQDNPWDIFSKAKETLVPGGRMLIRVPVSDSEIFKLEKEFWFQLDAPRHLFIPNTKSIEILAKEFGFNLYKIDFDSAGNQFWITDSYKKGRFFIEIDPDKDYSKKELRHFDQSASNLNRLSKGDQACFYLKKI